MKKLVLSTYWILVTTLALAQQYPIEPTFEKVKNDFKAHVAKGWATFLTEGLKVPPAMHSKVELIPATKEMGFYAITGYFSSDDVWKARLGKGYKDLYFQNIAVHLPKEIHGVEYYFTYNVNYSRLTKEYEPLNNWVFSYTEEAASPIAKGVTLPNIAKRKEILLDYFKNNYKSLETAESVFSNWIKIEDFIVNEKYTRVNGILQWSWNAVINYENLNGEEIDVEYVRYDFNVNYNPKTGTYTPVGIYYSRNDVTSDESPNKRSYAPEKPMVVGNLFENGFDAIYQKYAPKTEKKTDQKFFDQQIMTFDALIKTATIHSIPNIDSYFADATVLEELKTLLKSWEQNTSWSTGPVPQDIHVWEVTEALYQPIVKYDQNILKPYGGNVTYTLSFKYVSSNKKGKNANLGENTETKQLNFIWEYQSDGTFKITKLENY